VAPRGALEPLLGALEPLLPQANTGVPPLVSLSLRLKDLLGPVTRVKKKKRQANTGVPPAQDPTVALQGYLA